MRAHGSEQRRLDRTAIDVKVINGMGQGHFEQSVVCGRTAAEKYRADQLEHLDTQSLCAARGICYEPAVFTVQGGMERHTEALLTRIAKTVSTEEGISLAVAKSEIIQAVTLSLARSAAKPRVKWEIAALLAM